MPHIIVSNQVRLDIGPTFVGDEWSDPELMAFLGASLMKQLGNNYAQYKTELPPRQVLDRLEIKGFRLVAVTGVGQTCIWTLHKELSTCDQGLDNSSNCLDSSSNRVGSSSNGIDSSANDSSGGESLNNTSY